ncbi:MAG: putative NAD(P)H-dependent FMN-containing oxidoreductase YwqN [Lentisphaerae bacterium ADurb.Bin242]|nr:MAG: putative NAD(P)H-dependent FMN-containing oxidoreductase YwqN [Lentisphaerae bacterium ADurb.Bin242]
MKILILNGSPRLDGNTRTALHEIEKGIRANKSGAEVEFIDVACRKLSPCIACDGCKENGGSCVIPDESSALVQKVFEADVVIFGTPVYWWGVSAQLKMLIDKFYSKDTVFKEQKKRIGLVIVGAAGPENKEYELIRGQFQCICDYLGWNLLFTESISAWNVGDLAKNTQKMTELGDIWKKL